MTPSGDAFSYPPFADTVQAPAECMDVDMLSADAPEAPVVVSSPGSSCSEPTAAPVVPPVAVPRLARLRILPPARAVEDADTTSEGGISSDTDKDEDANAALAALTRHERLSSNRCPPGTLSAEDVAAARALLALVQDGSDTASSGVLADDEGAGSRDVGSPEPASEAVSEEALGRAASVCSTCSCDSPLPALIPVDAPYLLHIFFTGDEFRLMPWQVVRNLLTGTPLSSSAVRRAWWMAHTVNVLALEFFEEQQMWLFVDEMREVQEWTGMHMYVAIVV